MIFPKTICWKGGYHDTIYVTSDSGYESITIGDTSANSKKGFMLLYTKNTSKKNSFPRVEDIEKLLWKVVKKEMLETGEGKAAYFEWDGFEPLKEQLEYFSEVVLRTAEKVYPERED